MDTTLTLDSAFPELVDYWLADIDMEARIAPSTRFTYERDMRQLVLPTFEHLTLREIGVARCDALLKQLGQKSHAGPSAPRRCCAWRSGWRCGTRSCHAIRAVIKAWEQKRGTSSPNPEGQLGQIVEVVLSTSARIGEVLAIRRCDVDVTTSPPTLRIAGTIIYERNVGTYRQVHPRDRPIEPDRGPAVIHRRSATPPTPQGSRRRRDRGVHPHMFRRTVATLVNEQAQSTSPPSCSATPTPR